MCWYGWILVLITKFLPLGMAMTLASEFCGSFYSIQALLSAPNPDDPLSENIAKHWKTNEAEAVETGMSFLLA